MKNTEINYNRIGYILKRQFQPKGFPQREYDHDKIKWLFWRSLSSAVGYKEVECDGNLKYVFNNLTKYIAADESCEWPLDRGIFMFGKTGIGKTLMLRIANKILKQLHDSRAFKIYPAEKIGVDVGKEGGESIHKFTLYNALIDDIGIERLQVQHYGSEFAPIEDLVYHRYRRFTDSSQVSHFTSNLEPGEIEDTYGLRVYSRLSEMTTFVFCDAADKRL